MMPDDPRTREQRLIGALMGRGWMDCSTAASLAQIRTAARAETAAIYLRRLHGKGCVEKRRRQDGAIVYRLIPLEPSP